MSLRDASASKKSLKPLMLLLDNRGNWRGSQRMMADLSQISKSMIAALHACYSDLGLTLAVDKRH